MFDLVKGDLEKALETLTFLNEEDWTKYLEKDEDDQLWYTGKKWNEHKAKLCNLNTVTT